MQTNEQTAADAAEGERPKKRLRTQTAVPPRTPWTSEEDQKLIQHVEAHGERLWTVADRDLRRSHGSCKYR